MRVKLSHIGSIILVLAAVGLAIASPATAATAPGGSTDTTARSSAQTPATAEPCHLPVTGWADCEVVKALPDDAVEVYLEHAVMDEQVDCNLNELNSGNQLNDETASMRIGGREFLWHNNTGGTVWAELRCASPAINGFTAYLDVIRW